MAQDIAAWRQSNQVELVRQLDAVREALERYSERVRSGEPKQPAEPLRHESGERMAPPAAIDVVCGAFGLTGFERSILLLCAGVELDARYPAACAAAQGDEQRPYPTFSLALAALPDAHWSALAPAAALRRNLLIQVGDGSSLTMSSLRIDERILHFLCGINLVDERLAPLLETSPADEDLVPSHREVAEQITATWTQAVRSRPACIQLTGPDAHAKRTISSAACAAVGMGLLTLNAEALPATQAELETILRLVEREAVLFRAAVLVDADSLDSTDAARAASVLRLIERLPGAVLLSTRERRTPRHRTLVTIEVRKPRIEEQRGLWRSALGEGAQNLNGTLRELGAQFDVGAHTIRAAAIEARASVSSRRRGRSGDDAPSAPELAAAAWSACRAQARPRLDDLAERIDTRAGWEDLILPEQQKSVLHEIASHVRRRSVVYEDWGFASRGGRGLGISALFAGVSGTGKTMAAEVIAHDLELDLYRVDLSATVSKYIGETEKNLARIFDAAEEGGAVLLFDEADALFGKRSEVKDSHDRYANIEVSYLLQRMESYRGLAILTTNLKSAVDTAFMRRLRFVVQFPFPDASHRAEIWRRIFPASTPTEGLDPDKLAQLAVSGGNIRNAALNAAFVAADAGEPVGMRHVLRAAQSEYAKLEKTLTEAETMGWLDG